MNGQPHNGMLFAQALILLIAMTRLLVFVYWWPNMFDKLIRSRGMQLFQDGFSIADFILIASLLIYLECTNILGIL